MKDNKKELLDSCSLLVHNLCFTNYILSMSDSSPSREEKSKSACVCVHALLFTRRYSISIIHSLPYGRSILKMKSAANSVSPTVSSSNNPRGD